MKNLTAFDRVPLTDFVADSAISAPQSPIQTSRYRLIL